MKRFGILIKRYKKEVSFFSDSRHIRKPDIVLPVFLEAPSKLDALGAKHWIENNIILILLNCISSIKLFNEN